MLVVTGDESLWAQAVAAADGRNARQFDTVDELLSSWTSGLGAVVLLDARALTPLADAVKAVIGSGAGLIPVALVEEAHRSAAIGLERRGVLFDHLPLPVDLGTAKTVIDRAAEESAARLALLSAPAAVEPLPEFDGGATIVSGDAPALTPVPGGRRRLMLIGGGLALGGVVAVGAWLVFGGGSSAGRTEGHSVAAPRSSNGAAAAVPGAPVAVPAEVIEAELERARAAMRDKRFLAPTNENALSHYRTVLELDGQNGEARQGVERIAELLYARTDAALLARDYFAALRALEAARTLKPADPRLPSLDAQIAQHAKDLSSTQIEAAIEANAFTRAASLITAAQHNGTLARDQVERLQAESGSRASTVALAELARRAQTRITQGRLLEPAGDSAKSYLQELQTRGGDVARLMDAYAARLAADTRSAIARGAWSDGEHLLAELGSLATGASLVPALQRDLSRARETGKGRAPAATELPAAAEPVREVVEPASAAAAAATLSPPATPEIQKPARLAASLTLDYPPAAARAGTEGWVEIEFDVTPAGRAENLRVASSSVAGVFDSAALAAVRRARLAPALTADGTAVRTRLQLRVRFKLEGRS